MSDGNKTKTRQRRDERAGGRTVVAVSKRLRHEVMRRDGFRCRYCHAEDQPLTIDHVTPTTLGGSDDPSNLVTACKDCNAGKSATSPDERIVAEVASDALKWSRAIKQAAEEIGAHENSRRADEDRFREVWDSYTDRQARRDPLSGGWRSSVSAWRCAGVSIDELERLIDDVMGRDHVADRFAYFCGAAWKVVRQRQERAHEIIREQTPASCDGSPADVDDEFETDDVDEHINMMVAIARKLEGVECTFWCEARDFDDVDFVLHRVDAKCMSLARLIRLISEEKIVDTDTKLARYGIERGYAVLCQDCGPLDPTSSARSKLLEVMRGPLAEVA